MRNIIIDLQNFDTWKIRLTIAINFISSKDVEEMCVMLSRKIQLATTIISSKDVEGMHAMHPRRNNIKFISHNDAGEVVDELSESLRSRYQGNLETSITGSDFIFDSGKMMYCKYHKVNFRRRAHISIL